MFDILAFSKRDVPTNIATNLLTPWFFYICFELNLPHGMNAAQISESALSYSFCKEVVMTEAASRVSAEPFGDRQKALAWGSSFATAASALIATTL